MGADSLEDLMQQPKSPVAKNDSFERIGSDEGKFILVWVIIQLIYTQYFLIGTP